MLLISLSKANITIYLYNCELNFKVKRQLDRKHGQYGQYALVEKLSREM